MQALTSVIGAMMSLDGEADEWPEWAAAVLEEIAYLLDHKPKKGDDKQDIVPGHLVALTLDDLWLVIEEVVKVNKTPFLNITKKLPQDFILMISTLSSEIGKIFKEINSMVLETVTSTNFSGGVQNTGKSSTASQSRKKKGSPRKKSIA